MSTKSGISFLDIHKVALLVAVALLLVSCATPQQRMTQAALQGDNATLNKLLRPGAGDINTPVVVDESGTLCPGRAAQAPLQAGARGTRAAMLANRRLAPAGPIALTPLQAASCTGHAAAVKILLENKADPNLATSTGDTPLSLALRNGHMDVVRLLVKGGANPDAADAGGDTALMFAAQWGDKPFAEFMLKNGASVNIRNKAGDTALLLSSTAGIAKMLTALGSDPLLKNNNGESALHIAGRKGNAEAARFFLEQGVDAALRNKDGATALSLARAGNHGDVAALIEETLRKSVDEEVAEGDRAASENGFSEALSHYVAALPIADDLGDPVDWNLRVKMIKYVNSQEEPPALSDKAREHLVRGSYMLKHGQDVSEVEKEMAEALRADPWWLDGYYNLGLLQAQENQFGKATRNLGIFIAAAPPGPKSQAAQDKIYELKLAREEADKIMGMQGQWIDNSGRRYNVTIGGSKLQIVSPGGLVFALTLTNNVIEGSVESGPYGGPHGCTIPGQIHPVTGRLDSNARGMSLEYVWSTYDTRYHCVNMMGIPSNCCLLCDEVCDGVTIIGTNSTSLRLVSSR
jgi:ankyrin repeat protein